MKDLGIIRNVDGLGRVVIPKEVRRTQGWEMGQAVEMFMDGDKLVIQAYGKEQEKEEMITQIQQAHSASGNRRVREILENTIEFIKKG